MILLTALLAGSIAGLGCALLQKRSWTPPLLRSLWLVLVAFLPQLFAIYLPFTRTHIPNGWASAGLLISLTLLLAFCWLNRRVIAVWRLALGLVLNFLVMASNGGFMPISPQTASRLIPQETVQAIPPGSRFGFGKDVLLKSSDTRLVLLSDRFLPPVGFSYQVAFSLGDVVIAIGAFWMMAFPKSSLNIKPIK